MNKFPGALQALIVNRRNFPSATSELEKLAADFRSAPKTPDANGQTALHVAMMTQAWNALPFLLTVLGVDPYCTDANGLTAADWAYYHWPWSASVYFWPLVAARSDPEEVKVHAEAAQHFQPPHEAVGPSTKKRSAADAGVAAPPKKAKLAHEAVGASTKKRSAADAGAAAPPKKAKLA